MCGVGVVGGFVIGGGVVVDVGCVDVLGGVVDAGGGGGGCGGGGGGVSVCVLVAVSLRVV